MIGARSSARDSGAAPPRMHRRLCRYQGIEVRTAKTSTEYDGRTKYPVWWDAPLMYRVKPNGLGSWKLPEAVRVVGPRTPDYFIDSRKSTSVRSIASTRTRPIRGYSSSATTYVALAIVPATPTMYSQFRFSAVAIA